MLFPFHDDNPTSRFPMVTCAIIGMNVIAFLYTNSLHPLDRSVVVAERGFVPKRIEQLSDPNLVVEVPLNAIIMIDRQGQPRRITRVHRLQADRRQVVASMLTAMFLHGGWMHLLGNMWFLWLFGNNIEDRLGHVPFILLYVIGGLSAWACHWAVQSAADLTTPVIGASGAVAVILGAYAVTFPAARVRCLIFIVVFFTVVELPALLVLGFWFVTQLFSGLGQLGQVDLSGGVAWWAHIGGFVAGAALMPLFSAVCAAPPRLPNSPLKK